MCIYSDGKGMKRNMYGHESIDLYYICLSDHGYNWERGALLPGVPYGAEKIYRDFEPSQNQVGWTNKQTDRQWFIHP